MRKHTILHVYQQLIEELKEKPHEVLLSSGAALVVMGLREHAPMLHVDVLPGVYTWAAGKYGVVQRNGIDEYVLFNKHVALHKLSEDTGRVCVENVWMYSPHELAIQKRHLLTIENRNPEKRLQDQVELDLLMEIRKSPVRYTARMA